MTPSQAVSVAVAINLLTLEQRHSLQKARRQAYLRAWREKNREKKTAARLIESRTRARRRAAPGKCSLPQLEARVAFYGNKCAYCSGPYETIDHVIPLSRGGSNWPANLRPACRKCNTVLKKTKTLKEWRP